MATNAGEVRIRLAAQSRELRQSLKVALAQMRALRREAILLNRTLSRRSRFPAAEQSREFRQSLEAALATMRPLRREAVLLNRTLSRRFRFPAAAQIKKLAPELQRVNRQGTSAFTNIERASQRSARSIDASNRSVTLLVAKFALLVFAAQTVANILDATFGQALRNIDEFEQGVISTAAALTNIADLQAVPGATFGDAFAQNLTFVRDVFTELEIIAGNFFSSANELQLAFNTLAARGVAVRREELTTLGLISDQIKLQTRGQASSIQIAQEIRNLFTGQVRAADQLAQLIRAQGGDVKEISAELRRTGSLAPLEPFVAGLREALGLIQGLLVPALARFQAIAERIGRLAFAEVFRDTVGFITEINNKLDATLPTVAGIANLIVNRVARALRTVFDLVKAISSLLLLISTQIVPLTAVGVGFLVRRFSVLAQLVAVLTGSFIASQGGVDALSEAFRVIVNVARIAFLLIINGLNKIGEFFVKAPTIVAIFANEVQRELLQIFRTLVSAAASVLSFFGVESGNFVDTIDEKISDLEGRRRELQLKLAKDSEGNTALDSLRRSNTFLEGIIDKLSGVKEESGDAADNINEFAKGLGSSKEEVEAAIRAAEEAARGGGTTSPFPTTEPVDEQARQMQLQAQRSLFNSLRRLREAEAKRNLEIDRAEIDARSRLIDEQLAQQNISAEEAAREREDLLRTETQLQLNSIQERIENEKELFRLESQRLRETEDASTLNTKIGELSNQVNQRLVDLDQERLSLQNELSNELQRQRVELERAQTAARLSLQDAIRRLRVEEQQRELRRELRGVEGRREQLDAGVTSRDITARQAFQERQQLLRQERDLRVNAIQEQINAENEAFRVQAERIRRTERAEVASLKIRELVVETEGKVADLKNDQADVQDRINNQLKANKADLEASERSVRRAVQDLRFEGSTSFIRTVSDELKEFDQRVKDLIDRLKEEDPGFTDADQTDIEAEAAIQRLRIEIGSVIDGVLSTVDQAFDALVDGLVQGSINFRDVAQDISRTLIESGLRDLVNEAKKAIIGGLEDIFGGIGGEAAKAAAQALAVGIGILFAVLSRTGNDASFSPTGGTGGGSVVQSTQQVRGIIGGDTSIAIAELNLGLQEALIPTNAVLSQIERNTRALAELNLNIDPEQLSASIQSNINDIINQALLQVSP